MPDNAYSSESPTLNFRTADDPLRMREAKPAANGATNSTTSTTVL